MKCPSCGFHNLPGLAACGRCATSLVLSASAVNVHPPRASWLGKRTSWRYRYWKNRLQEEGLARPSRRLVAELSPYLADSVFAQLPPLGVLVRSVLIPGWGQYRLGLRVRAALFGGLFAAAALLDLVLFGTPLGNLMLGITFSIHVSAVLDLFVPTLSNLRERLVAGVLVMGGLYGLLYFPASTTIDRFAMRRTIDIGQGGPLEAGDSVLVRPTQEPAIGSVVLYQRPRYRTIVGPFLVLLPGEHPGRLLALPGQQVKWDGRRLAVGDARVDANRLDCDLRFLPTNLDFIVPQHTALVAPFDIRQLGHVVPAGVWQGVYLVEQDQIIGQVYRIMSPWSRRGPVDSNVLETPANTPREKPNEPVSQS